MKAIICDRLKAIKLCLGVDSTLKSTIDIEDGTALVVVPKQMEKRGMILRIDHFITTLPCYSLIVYHLTS